MRQKARTQLYSWYWKSNMNSVVAPKIGSHLLLDIIKQNNRHTIPPQTHISFVMPRPKGVGSRHTCDNRCFNRNGCHSKSNELSLTVRYVSPPSNNSVINRSQLSLVRQQSSSSSHFTPRDNQCFNSKDSKSKSNEFPFPLIPVPPPLNN